MKVTDTANVVTELPRGGYLVKTPEHNIQFGAPPETIKDTIGTEDSVPSLFVLPRYLFHWQKGINVADMEFPIYFNFFLKKRKVTIFCTEAQARRIIVALREAIFGPHHLDLSKDVDIKSENIDVPDITNELAYFRGNLHLTDLFSIKLFKNGVATHGNTSIRINERKNFDVFYKEKQLAEIPGTVNYTPKYDIGQRLPEPFISPRFAVTCLGPKSWL